MEKRDHELLAEILKRHQEASVYSAEHGDPSELIAKLLGGGNPSPSERRYLAGLLQKHSNPKKARKSQREVKFAQRKAIWEKEGGCVESFVSEIEEETGYSRTHIFRILRAAKENPEANSWYEAIRKIKDL